MKKVPHKMVLGIALALLVIRCSLPFILKRVINQKLSAIPEYQGHVEGVSLALWRGAFALKNLELKHTAGDMSLDIGDFDFKIEWIPLLHRTVVARLTVSDPQLRILAKKPTAAVKKTVEKTKEANQLVEQKTGQSLPDLLASLIPFKISQLKIQKGALRFKGETPDQANLEARVTDINVQIENLTNSRKLSDTLTASGHASGLIMDTSPVHIDLKLNPIAKKPQFDLSVHLDKLLLTDLNPILEWEWGLRVKEGSFTFLSEAVAKDGAFKGYIKPLLKDVQIDKSKKRNPVQVIKEAVVKVVVHVLKNNQTQTVATEVPFEGRLENPQTGIWEAISEVLRNAFVSALRPHFDPTFRASLKKELHKL